jgi:CheY-like chemotaxis protein
VRLYRDWLPDAERDAMNEVKGSKAALHKEPVLIIDDARTTRTHLRLMLEALFECHTAASAEEGLQIARSVRPRAILLDVQMPGMDGLQCLAAIKADPVIGATPVVMVTTRGEEESIERARKLGCNAYVAKPVQSGELFTTLRALLKAD